jgi:hypothetical protein
MRYTRTYRAQNMTHGGWQLEGQHVTPRNDVREHVLSLRCDCQPTRDVLAPEVIIHNAFDGREAYEEGRKPQ